MSDSTPVTAASVAMDKQATCIRRTRAIRSFCYRMRDTPTPEKGNTWEASMKVIIEALEGFDGWSNFGETWDLDRERMLKDEEYLQITPLMFSIRESWEAEVRQRARELPTKNAPRGLQLP